MGIRPLDELAREHRRLLESLAHLPTTGVQVRVVDDGPPRCNGEGVINLPKHLFQLGNELELIRAFRHELQHARDFLDHVDWSEMSMLKMQRMKEVMEVRALLSENRKLGNHS